MIVPSATNQLTNGATGETAAQKIDRITGQVETIAQAGERAYQTGRSWWDKISGEDEPQPKAAAQTKPAHAAQTKPAQPQAASLLPLLPVVGIAFLLLRR